MDRFRQVGMQPASSSNHNFGSTPKNDPYLITVAATGAGAQEIQTKMETTTHIRSDSHTTWQRGVAPLPSNGSGDIAVTPGAFVAPLLAFTGVHRDTLFLWGETFERFAASQNSSLLGHTCLVGTYGAGQRTLDRDAFVKAALLCVFDLRDVALLDNAFCSWSDAPKGGLMSARAFVGACSALYHYQRKNCLDASGYKTI
mmetsp:Transcript_45533/g.91919  ORF Transcript_45533/g.91919 Transcript_45533/m.91919 type:complete len:200 (+) Transcript_45533:152-751(+)